MLFSPPLCASWTKLPNSLLWHFSLCLIYLFEPIYLFEAVALRLQWRKKRKSPYLTSAAIYRMKMPTWAESDFPWDPAELRLKLLPVLEWTFEGSDLIRWGSEVGLSTFVADVAAGSVAVDVFDALNGDMKPDLFMDRLSESIMASTWIILMQLQHDGLSWK